MDKYLWQHLENFGTKDILAAAGSVIASWNLCEIALMSLLSILIPSPPHIGRKAFAILGNASRLELLRECSGTYGDDIADRINEFAAQYAICLENRNLIAHSIFQRDLTNLEENEYQLVKFTKDSSEKVNVFSADESGMLEIANGCWTTYQFGMQIHRKILTLPGNQLHGAPDELAPLPDKPRRPNKLKPLSPVKSN